MDIEIKLNPVKGTVEDKSSSEANVGLKNSSDSKLLKKKSFANQTTKLTNNPKKLATVLINTAEVSQANLTNEKPMNSKKSINRAGQLSRAETDSIKRPIETALDKSNQTNYRPYSASNLTSNLTSHSVDNQSHKLTSDATFEIATHNATNSNKATNATNLTNQLTNRSLYKAASNNLTLTNNLTRNDHRLSNSNSRLIVADTVARSKRSVHERRRIEISKIYFEGWKDVPHCLPEIINKANNETILSEEDRLFRFQLALQPADDSGLNCGLVRMRNKITDDLDYQHTILIEYNEWTGGRSNGSEKSRTKKDALLVHCKLPKANFFQTNQLLWWSSRIKRQMLDQQRQFEEQQQQHLLKQTNRSDNEQTEAIARSDFTSDRTQGEQLTFDDGRADKLDLNRSIASSSFRQQQQQSNQQRQRIKRASPFFANALPENFTESVDELIDYSGEIQGKTPVPKIHIVVRQHGQPSSPNSSLEVLPGTPLEIMIYLDKESANVYGLLVSYLKVTDNNFNKAKPQEEVIILDGCSIDPYIFGNFVSNDAGKSILARFRAFRFPGSMFVLFVSTVTVCIGQCRPVPDCAGSDQPAYGRRRRDLNNVYANETTAVLSSTTTLPPSLLADAKNDFELKPTNRKGRKLAASMRPDANKVFEVEMSTIIRVAKPKEVTGMIKNEYRDEGSSNGGQAASRPNTRPITARKMKKRYDSNQSLNKLSQSFSFKTAPINFSGRLSSSLLLYICLSRFAFSAFSVFLSSSRMLA